MVVVQYLSVIQWIYVSLLMGISGVQSARLVFDIGDVNPMKEMQDFYQKLENHLARDNTTLFLLKSHIFFQFPSYSSVDVQKFTVCLSMENNSVTNCSVSHALWWPENFNGSMEGSSYCWNFQWSNSAILGSLTIDQLIAFDNVFGSEIYRNTIARHRLFTLSFHLQSPPCLSETDIEDVLVELLSWIKAYARSSGRPSSWDRRDKGFISKRYFNDWITETYAYGERSAHWAHSIRVGLLCAFTFLNILIPMILAKYSTWPHTVFKQRNIGSHQFIVSVYLGTTIILALWNLLYILFSLHFYLRGKPYVIACILPMEFPCRIPSGTTLYNDLVAAFLVKVILFPITIVVELLIASCTPKPAFPILCCHFPFVRGTQFMQKTIHTIALWNIFVFIQILLGLMIIPFCILLFVNPTVVITYISSVIFLLLYIISILVAFLYFCRQLCHRSCKRCGMSLFRLVGTIAGFGLVFTIVTLYYTFTIYGGAHNSGITGVLLSLLPSIVISLVGWLIKNKLYSNATRDATNTSNNLQELVAMGRNHPRHGNVCGIERESDEELLPV